MNSAGPAQPAKVQRTANILPFASISALKYCMMSHTTENCGFCKSSSSGVFEESRFSKSWNEIEPVATRRLLNAGVLRRPTTRSGIRARWSGSSGTSSSQSAASCRRVKKGVDYLKPSVGGFLILPGSPHVPRDHVGVWLACGGPGEIALAIVDVELTGSCRSSATGARSTTRRCPSWCRGGSGW